jgi:hypothetical protein
MTLASSRVVKILEARFYPGSKSGLVSVVIGRVFCEGRTAKIEPKRFSAETVRPFEPVELYDKLEFLVGSAIGDTFHSLVKLRSGFWSFTEIPGDDGLPGVA